MAEASSSTSITVTWTEPSMPNGVIRRYNVTYFRTANGMSDMQQVSVTTTTAELSGLDIFTSYTIFVEAFTVAVGAASDTVTEVTNEDGKSSMLFADWPSGRHRQLLFSYSLPVAIHCFIKSGSQDLTVMFCL